MMRVHLNSFSGLPVLWRGLVLGVLVPSILLGPAFASGLALLHVHGPEGLHEHVLPASVSRGDSALLQVWHEGEHGVAEHSVSEHAAHERVSHEGESAGAQGLVGPEQPGHEQGEVVGGVIAHFEEVPGHVPHGTVVELTVSPASRPNLQGRSADQLPGMSEELPPVLVGDFDLLALTGPVPAERAAGAASAVRRGRCSGALRVLRLSGGLLI